MIVGVAGKYCSGKNGVVALLEEFGFVQIDVDSLGHRALEEKRQDIAETFGSSVIDARGNVDRRVLGSLVFKDRNALRSLESIVHRHMVRMVEDIIARSEKKDIIINAALLFHMGLARLCDVILWVKAPLILRIVRGMRRDGLPFLRVAQRIWSQRKLKPQIPCGSADIYSVGNRGNREALKKRVYAIARTAGLERRYGTA